MLDEIAAGAGAVIITKRSRPVARLVPVEQPQDVEAAVLARLRGAGLRTIW